jgi:hypothetical protein
MLITASHWDFYGHLKALMRGKNFSSKKVLRFS